MKGRRGGFFGPAAGDGESPRARPSGPEQGSRRCSRPCHGKAGIRVGDPSGPDAEEYDACLRSTLVDGKDSGAHLREKRRSTTPSQRSFLATGGDTVKKLFPIAMGLVYATCMVHVGSAQEANRKMLELIPEIHTAVEVRDITEPCQ